MAYGAYTSAEARARASPPDADTGVFGDNGIVGDAGLDAVPRLFFLKDF